MKILLILILLAVALWNAYVILWKTESNPAKVVKYSKIWHTIGMAVRVGIYFVPFFVFKSWSEALKWTLLFIAVGGVLYDFIINLVRYLYNGAPALWYVDNKGWNAFFLKFLSPAWYWIARGAFVVATIIFFLL